MYLSNTMPELNETETRYKGLYIVEYRHPELNQTVAAHYMSVTAFIELNGLPETEDYRKAVFRGLGNNGYFSDYNENGDYVRVMVA